MTRADAIELLDLIVARAAELRAAGVRSVNLGGAAFTLAPAELEADNDEAELEEGPSDVLHDSWTYGVPATGAPAIVPARKRTPL